MFNLIKSLLGDVNGVVTEDLSNIVSNVSQVAKAVIGLVTIAVTGLAIYLAFKFFTADDDTKRKNAKAQMIYAIIGIVVLVVVLILSDTVKNAITNNL